MSCILCKLCGFMISNGAVDILCLHNEKNSNSVPDNFTRFGVFNVDRCARPPVNDGGVCMFFKRASLVITTSGTVKCYNHESSCPNLSCLRTIVQLPYFETF